jgi:galactose mutarotase-like enzyme
MPKHGCVRHNENFKIVQESKTEASFILKSNDKLFAMYPFDFQFTVHYKLKANTLEITYEVENKDSKTLFFSVGGHPAFNCPLDLNESYTDYILEFENTEDSPSYLLNLENGLLTEATKQVFTDKNKIQLHPQLFDEDALVFKQLNSRKLSLTHSQNGPVLSVAFEDFSQLGIWAKPGAPYVCIEPWLGFADVENTNQQLKTKEGILALASKTVFKASYSIEINSSRL